MLGMFVPSTYTYKNDVRYREKKGIDLSRSLALSLSLSLSLARSLARLLLDFKFSSR
jgi:hypothetical protein